VEESWYINYYLCERCGCSWTDPWDCMCNDRCPNCDIEMTPYASYDFVAGKNIDHTAADPSFGSF
jgi:hypothetical protein